MADFQFYLNRQGPRGNTGEKGDTGFSPFIEVDVNTAAEYRLKVVNEDSEFVTDNLRGSAVEDLGGTYMRYDPETQKMFAGTPDSATNTAYGVVRIASEEDVEKMDSVGVVSPAQVADSLHIYLKSTDGSLVITQDEEDSKTNLLVNFEGITSDISGLESRVTGCESAINNLESADVTITNNINNLQGRMTIAENEILSNSHVSIGLDSRLQTLEQNVSLDEQTIASNTVAITNLQNNKVDKVAGKGLSTNDFTNADSDKLAHAVVDSDLASVAFSGDYDDLTNKPNIPSINNMMTVDTQQSVTGPKTFMDRNLLVGNANGYGVLAEYDNTIYEVVGPSGTSSTAGVVFGNTGNKALGANTKIKIYDPSISGYKLAEIINSYNLVAGNNITITRNTSTGKYEIASTVAIPANLVTTDTTQSISGAKTFTSPITESRNAAALINLNNTSFAVGGTISSTVNIAGLRFGGNNNAYTSQIFSNIDATGTNIYLDTRNYTSGSITEYIGGLLKTRAASDNTIELSFDTEVSGTRTPVNLNLTKNTDSTSDTTLATMGWVNSKIGSINSVLDAINGETI